MYGSTFLSCVYACTWCLHASVHCGEPSEGDSKRKRVSRRLPDDCIRKETLNCFLFGFCSPQLCIVTVTGEMRDDVYKELTEEEEVVRELGGCIVVPTSKNRFPILLRLPRKVVSEEEERANPLIADLKTEMTGGSGERDEEVAKHHCKTSGMAGPSLLRKSEILGAKHAGKECISFLFAGEKRLMLSYHHSCTALSVVCLRHQRCISLDVYISSDTQYV